MFQQIPNDTCKALSIMGGYFEAAKFTEELDNVTVESVNKESWHKAYADCNTFIQSILNSPEYKAGSFIMDWNSQDMVTHMGHDFWLTRNGHGAGFWDSPEVWGDMSDVFSNLARALGEISTVWVENDILYLE